MNIFPTNIYNKKRRYIIEYLNSITPNTSQIYLDNITNKKLIQADLYYRKCKLRVDYMEEDKFVRDWCSALANDLRTINNEHNVYFNITQGTLQIIV